MVTTNINAHDRTETPAALCPTKDLVNLREHGKWPDHSYRKRGFVEKMNVSVSLRRQFLFRSQLMHPASFVFAAQPQIVHEKKRKDIILKCSFSTMKRIDVLS